MSPRLTKCDMAVIALSIVCSGLLVLQVHVTGFNVIKSDFSLYNRWSQAWWDYSFRTRPHVPLYPMLLWAFRWLTFNRLDPAVVMHTVALPFVVGSYLYVHRIMRFHFPAARDVGFAVFGLYPFAGYCFSFAPADPLAICFLTGAAYYSLERKWRWFALCLAAALITHKATWPFLGLLAVDAVWRKKCSVFWPLVAGVPLLIFWGWGLYHGEHWLWLLIVNIPQEFASRSTLPIMDGLLGTFLHPEGAARLIRALAVLTIFTVTVCLLVWNLRHIRQPDGLFNFALLFPVVLLAALLNQYEVWAAFRFGRVIAIPLAACLVANEGLRRYLTRPVFFYLAAVTGVATNLLFAYYFMWVWIPISPS